MIIKIKGGISIKTVCFCPFPFFADNQYDINQLSKYLCREFQIKIFQVLVLLLR
jgi:hypothetical protein